MRLTKLIRPFQRHPFPVRALLQRVIALTYSMPADVLANSLPSGLEVDRFGDQGFLTVALVQTRALRPAFLPAVCGKDFFLAGFRIFARYRTGTGHSLRGLFILRSQTDSRIMWLFGNLLTRYRYQVAKVAFAETPEEVHVTMDTPDGTGNLNIRGRLEEGGLPAGSVFPNERIARRFCGPMPFTFDYEPETHSIIRIKGVRSSWRPTLVDIHVDRLAFFERYFPGVPYRLASAFTVCEVPYTWLKGVREPLSRLG